MKKLILLPLLLLAFISFGQTVKHPHKRYWIYQGTFNVKHCSDTYEMGYCYTLNISPNFDEIKQLTQSWVGKPKVLNFELVSLKEVKKRNWHPKSEKFQCPVNLPITFGILDKPRIEYIIDDSLFKTLPDSIQHKINPALK